MLENREEQLEARESAYTAPAEADSSTVFQFHSDLTPPAVQRPKRERGRRRLAAAIACVVIVLLCLALAISIFFLRYQITLTRDNGGFGVQISRRGSAFIAPENVFTDPADVRKSNGAYREAFDYRWNGETLKLETPQSADGMSWSGIYQEWSECVASVTTTDADLNQLSGSAVVMSEDGFLITSASVVLYAESIQVELQGESYPAALIGLDISSNLAVIRIQATGLKAAEFGQSRQVYPGEEIAVMGISYSGAPGIYPGTLTASADDYSYRGFVIDLFELYLSLGEQCGGAPVMNRYGQVIGIVNSDISGGQSDMDMMSFAIPMHEAKGIIDLLLEYGYVPGRPSSGLTVAEIPAAYAMYYKYPSCVYVAAVKESSTAEEAGVRKGDLILSANDIKIQSIDQLYAVINGMQAGDELRLELYREGDTAVLSFPLMEATRPVG